MAVYVIEVRIARGGKDNELGIMNDELGIEKVKREKVKSKKGWVTRKLNCRQQSPLSNRAGDYIPLMVCRY